MQEEATRGAVVEEIDLLLILECGRDSLAHQLVVVLLGLLPDQANRLLPASLRSEDRGWELGVHEGLVAGAGEGAGVVHDGLVVVVAQVDVLDAQLAAELLELGPEVVWRGRRGWLSWAGRRRADATN